MLVVVVPMPVADAVAAQRVVAPTVAMVVVTAAVAAISAVAHGPPTPANPARMRAIHKMVQHAVRKLRAQHAPRARPWAMHSPALTHAWKPRMVTAVSHAATLTTSNRPVTPRRVSRRQASRPATAATSVVPARAVVVTVVAVADAAATVVAEVAVHAVRAVTDLSAQSGKLLYF